MPWEHPAHRGHKTGPRVLMNMDDHQLVAIRIRNGNGGHQGVLLPPDTVHGSFRLLWTHRAYAFAMHILNILVTAVRAVTQPYRNA